MPNKIKHVNNLFKPNKNQTSRQSIQTDIKQTNNSKNKNKTKTQKLQ